LDTVLALKMFALAASIAPALYALRAKGRQALIRPSG
jgi:hypothetical protein